MFHELFEEIYIKDIINRYNIHSTEEFKELINILASSIGSLTNPTKLEKVLIIFNKSLLEKKKKSLEIYLCMIYLFYNLANAKLEQGLNFGYI